MSVRFTLVEGGIILYNAPCSERAPVRGLDVTLDLIWWSRIHQCTSNWNDPRDLVIPLGRVLYVCMCVFGALFLAVASRPPPRPAAAAHATSLQLQGDRPWLLKVRLGVLPGELEQHRVVEELVDRDVLAQALAAPRLDHELAREVRRGLRLERLQDDILVERVARHDGPMVEDREREGLR